MEVYDDLELAEEMHQLLIRRVGEMTGQRSDGIHLTQLIYCLTSSYWTKTAPLAFTKEAALTMGLGVALEHLLIPEEMRAKPGVCEGIEYSPDFWFRGEIPCELKTTRMSSKKTHTRELPETWLQQIKGYCYAEEKLEYRLGIVHLLGAYRPPFPEILALKFHFTQRELQDNWDYLLWRKAIYTQALANGQPPVPGKWCQDWECKWCRYAKSKIHCNLVGEK